MNSLTAKAEKAIVNGVLAGRATFVVQLILSLGEGYTRSSQAPVFAVVAAAMIVESVLFGSVLWRGKAIGVGVAAADVCFVAVALALEPVYSTPADRVGTWVAWGYGAAVVVSLSAGAGLRRPLHVGVAAVALSAVYLAVSLPATVGRGLTGTALTNSFAMLGFAAASWVIAHFIRDLALIADNARAEAVAVARSAELERQRMLLHDHATVLSWLSRTGLDPAMEVALRDQAGRASQQIKAFMAAERPAVQCIAGSTGGQPMLRDVLATVAGEFHDLPLTLNVDLVADHPLDGHVGAALAAAVRTLLHNVRCHAKATSVVVHADQVCADRWEVTVQDDGVGFNTVAVDPGYGLRVQAGEALHVAGLAVALDSVPGEGTKVAITGPSIRNR